MDPIHIGHTLFSEREFLDLQVTQYSAWLVMLAENFPASPHPPAEAPPFSEMAYPTP